MLCWFIIASCGSDDSGMDPESSELTGCTDTYATNFQSDATFADNSCNYTPVICSECDYVIEPDDLVLDNDELNLAPGAVICMAGMSRAPLMITNFHGNSDNPFIFTNCDGQAKFDRADNLSAIRITESSFIRLTGTGSDDNYGIQITKGAAAGIHAYSRATDLEIDHVEVTGVDVGIWTVTRPTCDGSANNPNFTQRNTWVHHNWIHNVETEGMYLGGSKWHSGFDNNGCPGEKLKQPDLIGVRVFNNIVEDCGWDGIQVGGAIEDCEIYNNVIKEYGLRENNNHQAGIQINPGTVGKIFANLIQGGTGSAIFLIGFDNLVYSNLIVNPNESAVHFGDREPPAGKSYRVVNNTILNATENAFNMNSKESVDNLIANNLLIDITEEDDFNNDDIEFSNNIMVDAISDLDFVNPGDLDFTPVEGSILIDSGAVVSTDDLIVDILMRKRVSGDGIDIGAFESPEN